MSSPYFDDEKDLVPRRGLISHSSDLFGEDRDDSPDPFPAVLRRAQSHEEPPLGSLGSTPASYKTGPSYLHHMALQEAEESPSVSSDESEEELTVDLGQYLHLDGGVLWAGIYFLLLSWFITERFKVALLPSLLYGGVIWIASREACVRLERSGGSQEARRRRRSTIEMIHHPLMEFQSIHESDPGTPL